MNYCALVVLPGPLTIIATLTSRNKLLSYNYQIIALPIGLVPPTSNLHARLFAVYVRV